MQLECRQCGRTLEFSGDPPSFCAYCGRPLGDPAPNSTVDAAHEAATLPPTEPIAEREEATPEFIGGYRLIRVLGSGGMGTVHESEEVNSGRRVAVKLLSSGLNASSDAVERFRREGKLASAIGHPRCVFVLAAAEDSGRPYIVMELMQGRTLKDLIDESGPLEPSEAIAKIFDVIEGLQQAHQLGVIHRDVKPSNCFLEGDGRVKIGDFGLSKSLLTDAHLTKTGAFMGTLIYAAPEQIRGEEVDEQTDVYSVAATLYFLLTGRTPFHGGDAAAMMARIVSDQAPSMRKVRPQLQPGLDKVVLRGLERNRERRWRTLDELKAALLPFVPDTLSIGGMGIRFGAYAVDHLCLAAVGMAITFSGLAVWSLDELQNPRSWFNTLAVFLMLVPWCLFFALPEWLYGCSLGKALFRLRVYTKDDNEPPSFSRALVRTIVFYLLLNLGGISWVIVARTVMPADFQPGDFAGHGFTVFLPSLIPFAGLMVGIVLMAAPMRARSGYRGLHERCSGTRVVQLPPKTRIRVFSRVVPQSDLLQPEGLPDQLGPYLIRGALGWSDNQKILLGEDSELSRQVWILLRPASEPPINEARQLLSRPARQRWLVGGNSATGQWDAFLAPNGSPLSSQVSPASPLSWSDTRPILEQLTTELVAAAEDDTLPATLGVGQVWVRPNGQVELLDGVIAGGEAPGDPSDEPDSSLCLVRQIAELALEGKPRDRGSKPQPMRAPMPLHAVATLNRFLAVTEPFRTLDELHAELHRTAELPAEVSRPRRAAHLATQMALMSISLFGCLLPLSVFPTLALGTAREVQVVRGNEAVDELVAGAICDLTAHTLARPLTAFPAVTAQFAADVALAQQIRAKLGLWERRRKEKIQAQSSMTRLFAESSSMQIRSGRRQFKPSYRQGFRGRAARRSRDIRRGIGSGFLAGGLAALFAWPIIWVVWAFLTRGGLSFKMFGLALVRGDGRRATLIQCGWRALLVWAPIAGLLAVVFCLDYWYWTSDSVVLWLPWFSWCIWWSAIALLIVYLVLTIRSPERGLHDRLAGTYVVPK